MKRARGSGNELTVISKTYDLILWTANHTSRFPRNHRHVLGTRIEEKLYDVLDLLIAAKFSRQRHEQLAETNRKLEGLRFLFRLAGACPSGLVFGLAGGDFCYHPIPQGRGSLRPRVAWRFLER